MREAVFALMMGGILLVIQTTSWGPLLGAYKPDLLLISVAWVGLRFSFTGGAVFSFFAGAAVDLFSGSPTGLFALIYCLVFLFCGYFQEVLTMEGNFPRALLIFLATVGTGILVVAARRIMGPVGFGWSAGLWILLKSIVTGGASLILFPVLEWSWTAYAGLAGTGEPH